MVALQIREVPDQVRDILVERARARGQSLQAYLLEMVEHEAQRAGNRALLNRFADRRDGSRLRTADAAKAVRIARKDRAG